MVVVVLELLPDTGSVGVPATVAVLEITVPSAVLAATVATIVTVAELPASSAPRAHVCVVVPVHVPLPAGDTLVHVALVTDNCDGIESVTVAAVAWFGPRLFTVIVYVRGSPALTGSGESVLVIDRSANLFVAVRFSDWLPELEPPPAQLS